MSPFRFFKSLLIGIFFVGAAGLPTEVVADEPRFCSYETYEWNTRLRRAVNHRTVQHPYPDLTEYEMDPQSGCSICREDQEIIHIPPLEPFSVCRKVADGIRLTLQGLLESGFPISTVVGYRVGKTRGEPDENGNRTGFSNHSFGVAVDINSAENGLYDQCLVFGPQCRLIRGGSWRPGEPGTLEKDGPVVKAFEAFGFKWGGEIQGNQKDFMHFSATGY